MKNEALHYAIPHFSFIGDGLSHVVFGAMAIASVMNFTNNTPFVMVVTVILGGLQVDNEKCNKKYDIYGMWTNVLSRL